VLQRRCCYNVAFTAALLLQRCFYRSAAATTLLLLQRCCYNIAFTAALLLQRCFYRSAAATTMMALQLVTLLLPRCYCYNNDGVVARNIAVAATLLLQ
jgi:hypothetical protein